MNRTEPHPAAVRPEPPRHLDADALGEWDRVLAQLERMGVLTEADGFALSIYCEAWSRKRLAEAEIDTHGLLTETAAGALKANPAVAIAKACDATMLRVLASFGLTAADRSRVKSLDAGPKDELTEFVNEKKKA